MLEPEALQTTASGGTMMQVKNALARAAAKAGAGLIEVLLPLHTLQQGPKAIQAAFREALHQHSGRVKLAVIDHVASFPPVVFDVKGLCSLCKASGAKGAALHRSMAHAWHGRGLCPSIEMLQGHSMSCLKRCLQDSNAAC
jgi:Fe-S cluster biogenesis protein NfuA